MKRISCHEGDWFSIEPRLGSRLHLACIRAERQLRPRFPILAQSDGLFKISGVVGTLDIGANTLIEISPKTDPDVDWIHAVLDLLVGSDRVDIAGERAAGLSPNRRSLLEVLASIYAARLERAIRRDGPILLMRRRHSTGSLLKGKLDVTKWAASALWKPHRFPVAFSTLTVDHEFSQALAHVAQRLASVSASVETRGRLRTLTRALRPGCAPLTTPPNQSALRRLPSQWAIYHPAWSIAVAILSRRSLLSSQGPHHGISIIIEAWPLLETLLERSLFAAVSIGNAVQNRGFDFPGKNQFPILTHPTGSATEPKMVKPDGRLLKAGRTVATFEAKYKRRTTYNWPDPNDIYQALVAAAACESPLAVLVYPESFAAARWRVVGMQGRPAQLIAIGLGLFTYRVGRGELERGQLVLDIVEGKNLPGQDEVSPLALVG